MAEQGNAESGTGSAELGSRPDPLRLALDAISAAERAANWDAPRPDVERLTWRAQMRTLYAIAEEVRMLRVDLREGETDGDDE